MHIDVYFDLICPWCYIGIRRLQRALGLRPSLSVEISWRPYMIYPAMPPEGMDHGTYMLHKFGSIARVRRLIGALEITGKSEEISFNFNEILITPNSLDAHRLVRYASEYGQAEPTVEALFKSHFVKGRDIGDITELCTIGRSVGLNSEHLRGYLEGGSDVSWVDEQINSSHRQGINGVPCYLINDELALQGAQPPEVIARFLDAAAA